MDLVVICKQTFIYFYEKVYRKPCPIDVSNSNRSLDSYAGFVERITLDYGESVGADYIWNYVWFQFGRYAEKIKTGTIGLTGKITPITVFGKKPHDAFNSRRVDMDWRADTSPLKIEFKITKAEFSYVKGVKFTTQAKVEIKEYNNDPIKKIASRGENPLITCRDMTDLYNAKDKSCKNCKAAVECKEMLKNLYPKIYKERNYE